MAIFDFMGHKSPEKRTLSLPEFSERTASVALLPDSTEPVTIDSALGVPAVSAAVNFLSATLASLPLNVFKKTEKGREKGDEKLNAMLHDAPNDEQTSFAWRKYCLDRVFTNGRSITYIERDSNGNAINLFNIDPAHVTIKESNFTKKYIIKSKNSTKEYGAKDIIDIYFGLKADNITAISPILSNKNTITLAISATKYASKFFSNGGIPPFVLTGNFVSGKALERAAEDVNATIRQQSQESQGGQRHVLALPLGHDIKPIGVDPEKSQLLDLQRFCIEEAARIFGLPPIFLQDLTHGTIGNTEQQDLHLVKHLIRRWVVQIEQELNLKLFGRYNNSQYVEFNLEGLLRGDFMTRMQGYAVGIQNAILAPNEIRQRENLPDAPKGGDLLIQGATVPLGSQTTFMKGANAPVSRAQEEN